MYYKSKSGWAIVTHFVVMFALGLAVILGNDVSDLIFCSLAVFVGSVITIKAVDFEREAALQKIEEQQKKITEMQVKIIDVVKKYVEDLKKKNPEFWTPLSKYSKTRKSRE